jgi:peroxiredoxin
MIPLIGHKDQHNPFVTLSGNTLIISEGLRKQFLNCDYVYVEYDPEKQIITLYPYIGDSVGARKISTFKNRKAKTGRVSVSGLSEYLPVGRYTLSDIQDGTYFCQYEPSP